MGIAICDNLQEPDSVQQRRRGIMKSSAGGKTYGYYMKAGTNNFMFVSKVRRQIDSAIHDHIIALEIIDRIRSAKQDSAFPVRIMSAVDGVLVCKGLKVS